MSSARREAEEKSQREWGGKGKGGGAQLLRVTSAPRRRLDPSIRSYPHNSSARRGKNSSGDARRGAVGSAAVTH